MPPAKPARKRAASAKSRSVGKKKGAAAGKKKATRAASGKEGAAKPSATCKTCGKKIRIPDGWSVGPAVRRHYWAKHRTTMQPERGDA